jgi:hypothetical protein
MEIESKRDHVRLTLPRAEAQAAISASMQRNSVSNEWA